MRVSEIDWHGRGNRRFDLPGDEPPADERNSRNPREVIGGNNPPQDTKLSEADIAMATMRGWLNDNPVVQTGKQAEEAKKQIESARGALADMEAERDGKVRPLNDRVDAINGAYKAVSAPFKKVLEQVKDRLTAYGKAVQAERDRVAAEAKRIADELVAKAREKERLEQEAIENAKAGEVDAGVAEKIVDADAAFQEAQRAIRQANVATRDAENVRIGGGGTRSLGMRTTTTLTLDDPVLAIQSMGGKVSEKTAEAILSDARAWRKLNDQRWPAGVTAVEDRKY